MIKKNWKRNFYILWVGQLFSVLSSSILQIALIWHLTAITQSAFVLSMASLAGFLPNALLGIIAGTFVDRANRKIIMIASDIFIAAISLTLVFAAINDELSIWLIVIVLASRSIGTAFHTPAISAATPLIVPTEELTKCAGYTQSLQVIGYMVGIAIAGFIYPIWSISEMVFLDVVGAIIATVATIVVKIPSLEKNTSQKNSANFCSQIKEGYIELNRHKGIFIIVWIATIFTILYSPINALFPLISLDYFNGTTIQASLAEIAFSLGMLVGGIILGSIGKIQNRGINISISTALMGLSISITGILPQNGFIVFVCLCIIMGSSVPLYSGSVTALIQEKIPPEYLGRIFGLYGSLTSLAMPMGLLLSGLFADSLGVNKWFLLSGISIIGISILCFILPSIRKIDREETL